mmetsp:Transcript_12336/g.23933  ORF Transcript_12336/g.23933 Transcript_12336/m.23933 type:complete len:102 (+) Transcript_12336:897-1202(+)
MAVTFFWEHSQFSSHATFLTSKWLVGSSSKRISALISMARARASFIFHPPEREEMGAACISLVKPTSDRACSTASLLSPLTARTASFFNTYSATPISVSSP